MGLLGKTPYKQHARRHRRGGSDPIVFENGLAARLIATTASLSCGGGFGDSNQIEFATDFDNIGLTNVADKTFTLPAVFGGGGHPIWGVHGYINLDPDAFTGGDLYSLWWNGPVNDVLYLPNQPYYATSEFQTAGYESDGYAVDDADLYCTLFLQGANDIDVVSCTITVVYLGQYQ